jgi:hypothetical protein
MRQQAHRVRLSADGDFGFVASMYGPPRTFRVELRRQIQNN